MALKTYWKRRARTRRLEDLYTIICNVSPEKLKEVMEECFAEMRESYSMPIYSAEITYLVSK